MAVWNDLLDDVMPEIAGSPPLALVTHHIKRAVLYFIEQSMVIRRTTDLLNWPGGAGAKALTNAVFGNELVTTTERVTRVLGVYYQGKRIDPATTEQLVDEFGPDWRDKAGTPLRYTEDTDGLYLVPYPPSGSNVLRLEVALALEDAAASFPDKVFTEHRDFLAMGAKGKLMHMSNKPWSDKLTGDINWGQFMARINAEKVKALRQTGKLRLQTKPTFF